MPSKLGLHINFITEADAMRDFILTARPVAIKTLHHDAGFWQEIKTEYPELLLVGRRYVESQPLADAIKEANELADSILNTPTVHICDAWEGYNEVSVSKLEPLCRFDRQLAELLHREQVRYIAGSWSVGTPDISDWQRPEMWDALRVADYIGVHEYCAPSMDDPRGMDTDHPSQGWFVLRYRKWYPTLPSDCQKPLLITECGIDSGAVHWDPGAQGGWRSFTDPEGYMEQLAWYDRLLQEDGFVRGATVFCWGTLDPAWDSHDLSGSMVNVLANYVKEQQAEGIAPVPSPPSPVELTALQLRVAELEQEKADLNQELAAAQARIAELEHGYSGVVQQLAEAAARIEEVRRALGG
jgi:hypothetical protein